ncbi:FkbM family methyltransferase [Humisphaera borealis]|uniref:FkbM family methyltransferase n=1 Tax=Humisphaera borealis TaxID=2807512 RepID=A0A7M2WY68_9BACT|nr:FkbM family methyltransferase [Humisphaera borealis]QOV90172.1 FkbM family methyltransferase [Humisphaera borealis]
MRELEDLFRHLGNRGFRPRTVIDVGVAHGTHALYAQFPDAYYHLFEPVAEFEKDIRWHLTRLRGEYWPVALSDKPGVQSLFLTGQSDGASLMHSDVPPENPQLRQVEVSTLDTAFKDKTVEGPILLKTDCQGADLKVIQGGLNFVTHCDVIVLEVGMFHYWGPSTPDFTDVIRYMADIGFVTYDVVGHMDRPRDGALGQVDVAFVKRDGMFRDSHKWS